MTKDEALKLALEALEEINKLSIGENAVCLPAEIDTAMDAIKEALAQRSFDYKEHAEGLQRDYDLLLAEYNELKAQRKPLSDEEIIDHFQNNVDTGSMLSFVDGVRYAEAAHGIKGEA